MRTIASKKGIKNWLQQLHVQKFDHGTRSQQAIIELLHHLTASSFSDPALVKSFFEELLFLKVYPASENIYQQAVSAYSGLLNRVQKNNSLLKELANTGLPVTTITGSFSYYLNKKLLTQKGIRVFLDDVGGDTDALMQLLGKGLTDIEQEMLSEEKLSWKKWLALFWGNVFYIFYNAFVIIRLSREHTVCSGYHHGPSPPPQLRGLSEPDSVRSSQRGVAKA